jgi:uncharacterized protein YecT (DUF1311 family)
MKTLIILFPLLFLMSISFAQTDIEEHSIDVQLKACLDSTQNQTTAGIMDCEGRARSAWDGELNKYYKLLMPILSSEEKEKLKTAQKNWLTYRDSEFLFARAIYYNLEGTMWRIAAVSRQSEMVKQRALELKTYHETLTEVK